MYICSRSNKEVMHKFKVGDKVRIIGHNSLMIWNDEMKENATGKEGKVLSASTTCYGDRKFNTYQVKTYEKIGKEYVWRYGEQDLEFINKEEKFKEILEKY